MISWCAASDNRHIPPMGAKRFAYTPTTWLTLVYGIAHPVEWDDRRFQVHAPLDYEYWMRGIRYTHYVIQAASEEEYLQLKADYVFHRLSS